MDAREQTPLRFQITERHLLLALLFYFFVVSILYAAKSVERDGSRSAIQRWRNQLLDWQEGENIHETHTFPNPPIMAMLLLPVVTWPEAVGLPDIAAALGWFYLKVAMTLLALHWVFRLVETPKRPFPLWAKVLTVLLSLRAITGDLMHGNVNLFILFLVVGFLHALQRRRDWLAGIVLGLAISCKVTPALFLGYLAWKRAWKAMLGTVAGLGLFFWPGVVPAAYLGWENNDQQVRSWIDNMVKPFLIEGFVTSEHQNQSLPGLAHRLLTESPSFVKYVNDIWTPDRYHNFFSLAPDAVRLIVKGCMILFVLFVVWTCRASRAPSGEQNPALATEYAVVVLGMLLFSERTWKHHCVTLLVPFAVLSYHLAVWWERIAVRRSIVGVLVATTLLMSMTSTSLLGRNGGKLAQVYGAYVAAFVLLLAALGMILHRRLRCTDDLSDSCGECPASWRKAG